MGKSSVAPEALFGKIWFWKIIERRSWRAKLLRVEILIRNEKNLFQLYLIFNLMIFMGKIVFYVNKILL